eukprot:sb/3478819/
MRSSIKLIITQKNRLIYSNQKQCCRELSGEHFGCKIDIPSLTNRRINRLKVKNTCSRNPTGVHVVKNSQVQSCSYHIASLIRVVENCLAVILKPGFLS